MEQPQWDPEQHGNMPIPLGAVYENPPNSLDRLREINETDPAFVRWVLVRSEEIMSILRTLGLDVDAMDDHDLKEVIAQSLVEAYDTHQAKIARDEIDTMYRL